MKQNDNETKPATVIAAPQPDWNAIYLKRERWWYRRDLRTKLYGLNEELRWCRRELRRSAKASVDYRARIQSHQAFVRTQARKLHLELAFLRGTPYSAAEKPRHSFRFFHYSEPYPRSPKVVPTREALEAWRKSEQVPPAPAPAPIAPPPKVEGKPGLFARFRRALNRAEPCR